MTKLPNEDIHPLTLQDERQLDTRRAVCTRYLADDEARDAYHHDSAGKLGLLKALLDAQVFAAGQTYELECMGVILGDIFVAETRLEWVIAEDELGRGPALHMPGTSILLYPLAMIAEPVARGDEVDLPALFRATAAKIAQMAGDEGAA